MSPSKRHNPRLRQLVDHVVSSPAAAGLVAPESEAEGQQLADASVCAVDMDDPQYGWTKQMRGIIWERHGGDLRSAEADLAQAGQVFKGQLHEELQRMAQEYGQENFAIPRLSSGWGEQPQLEPWLIISDPEDAQQISRLHTKKAGMYQPTFLGEGIFALNDVDEWKSQRHQIVAGVLPLSSLKQQFDTVKGSGADFMGLLHGLCEGGSQPIEMNETFSDRTLRTLGMTLMDSEEIFSTYSEGIRWSMTWNLSGFMDVDDTWEGKGGAFVDGVTGGVQEREYATKIGVIDGSAAPNSPEEAAQVRGFIDGIAAKCLARAKAADVRPTVDENGKPQLGAGHLMAMAAEIDTMERKHEYPNPESSQPTPTPTGLSNIEQSQLDTISSLIFAGHDTTANTLTWCCYELAKRPDIQERLRADIDRVIDVDLRRELTYDDLSALPYLTRVLHETLRLWPIVHYGTFRELVRPAKVKGANGEPVEVPAGTCVQIPHFSVHHSEEAWGPTVNEFDPDRDFKEKELWGETRDGKPLFRAWNPRSERFFPFQSAPRQCLGMNYAQMVMRVLISSILRTFEITLAPSMEGVPASEMSIARPLLKPIEGVWLKLTPRQGLTADAIRAPLAPRTLQPSPPQSPPQAAEATGAGAGDRVTAWREQVATARAGGIKLPMIYPWSEAREADLKAKMTAAGLPPLNIFKEEDEAAASDAGHDSSGDSSGAGAGGAGQESGSDAADAAAAAVNTQPSPGVWKAMVDTARTAGVKIPIIYPWSAARAADLAAKLAKL